MHINMDWKIVNLEIILSEFKKYSLLTISFDFCKLLQVDLAKFKAEINQANPSMIQEFA